MACHKVIPALHGDRQDIADPVCGTYPCQGNGLGRELKRALRVQSHQPGACEAGKNMGTIARAGKGKPGDLSKVLTGRHDGCGGAQVTGWQDRNGRQPGAAQPQCGQQGLTACLHHCQIRRDQLRQVGCAGLCPDQPARGCIERGKPATRPCRRDQNRPGGTCQDFQIRDSCDKSRCAATQHTVERDPIKTHPTLPGPPAVYSPRSGSGIGG